MRVLAIVLVAAAILFGIYEYHFKTMPVADKGTATTQAISLTGVRMDLQQIAQAERGYIALNSNCVSIDDLTSSGSLVVAKPGRDGYTYEVQCGSGDQFQITAHHPAAPEGSPIRYPQLAIDQTMQVSEIQ